MPGPNDRADIEAFLDAHEPIAEPTLCAVGDAVGDWRVLAFLGRGGSGEVYRVRHAQIGVVAAMKVLSRDDGAARDRFRREARILAEHSHPAFPRFLGYGEAGGRAYLVIELLEAMPLPSGDRDVARYLCKVCEGVAFLHGLGMVHRDIKPQNVLQRGATGQPVLIDLGLVKDTTLSPVHAGVSLSVVNGKATGSGTPKYSAPEQFAGGKISPAADVHALGVLANECFGGDPPRSWVRIIRRSTSSIPSQRYASVDEFVQAIRKRHKGRFALLALVPSALLLVAAIARLSWHYAIRAEGREAAAQSPRLAIQASDVVSSIAADVPKETPVRTDASPQADVVSQADAVSHPASGEMGKPVQAIAPNAREKVKRPQVSSSKDETNALSRASDADVPQKSRNKRKKTVTYPNPGVFGGDPDPDFNF